MVVGRGTSGVLSGPHVVEREAPRRTAWDRTDRRARAYRLTPLLSAFLMLGCGHASGPSGAVEPEAAAAADESLAERSVEPAPEAPPAGEASASELQPATEERCPSVVFPAGSVEPCDPYEGLLPAIPPDGGLPPCNVRFCTGGCFDRSYTCAVDCQHRPFATSCCECPPGTVEVGRCRREDAGGSPI